MGTTTRTKRTAEERAADAADALDRAEHGKSERNNDAVREAFDASGIIWTPPVVPRENALIRSAWEGQQRIPHKGEQAIPATLWVPIPLKKGETPELDEFGRPQRRFRPTTVRLFHISQTRPIDEPEPASRVAVHPYPAKLDPESPEAIEANRRKYSGCRFNDFHEITARYNSVGCKCGAACKTRKGDTVGYARQYGIICAPCWETWVGENAAADADEAAYAAGHG